MNYIEQYDYYKITGGNYKKLVDEYNATELEQQRKDYIQKLLDEVGADDYMNARFGFGEFIFEEDKQLPYKYKIRKRKNGLMLIKPLKTSKLGKEIAKKFDNFLYIFNRHINKEIPDLERYIGKRVGIDIDNDYHHDIGDSRVVFLSSNIFNLTDYNMFLIRKLKVHKEPVHSLLEPTTAGQFIDTIDSYNARNKEAKQ